MKKKLAIIIPLVILLLAGSGFGVYYFFFKDAPAEKEKDEPKKVATATPLLYEVTKPGSDTVIYLFGSIHIADEEAYPLPDAVMDAYEESEALAVEFDVIEYSNDMDAQIAMLTAMILPEGVYIEDVLSPYTYELLIEYLKDNDEYYAQFEAYNLAFQYSAVSSIIDEKVGLSSEDGIDMYFLELAKEDGKKILEVETSDSQTEMLLSFPDELYDLIIRYSILYEEEGIEETRALYETWLEGDEAALIEIIDEPSAADEKLAGEDFADFNNITALLDDYDYKMLDERDAGMVKKAEEYFKAGTDVFFVVGTAHIVGETGLAKSLAKLGYDVKVVEYTN